MESWKLPNIASVVGTLGDLKLMSPQQQSFLLLRRLATQYPPPNSFGKSRFSLDALVNIATAIGRRVRVDIEAA